MNKTTERNVPEQITVNADVLAGMLGLGKASAVKIGTEAGAKICIGKRTIYDVAKVKAYLNTLCGN